MGVRASLCADPVSRRAHRHRWQVIKKQELLDKLFEGSTDLTKLNLATSAFYCQRPGRSDRNIYCFDSYFHTHSCILAKAAPWSFACLASDPGVQVAIEKCVRLVGLYPHSATSEDMDRRNARFLCADCFMGADLARSWRGCVNSQVVLDLRRLVD